MPEPSTVEDHIADDGVVWLDGAPGDDQEQRRRPPTKAILIGLAAVGLAVALAVAWVVLWPKPERPYPVLEGLDRPPVVWWSTHLDRSRVDVLPGSGALVWWSTDPDGSRVVVLPHSGRLLVFDPETKELALVDPRKKREIWRQVRASGEQFFARESAANGNLLIVTGEGEGRRAVELGGSDGEVVREIQGDAFFSDVGTVYRYVEEEGSGGQLSPVSGSGSGWTADVDYRRGHPDLDWVERDGYLMAGARARLESPESFVGALSLSDGTPAPWLTDDVEFFEPVGGNYLSLLRNGTYAMLDPEGQTLWTNAEAHDIRVVDAMVFATTVDERARVHRLQRLDPVGGWPLWSEATELPPGANVASFEGRLLALTGFSEVIVQELNPANGQVRDTERFGASASGSPPASFIAGEGQLLVFRPVEGGQEILAIQPGEEDERWRRFYPGVEWVWPLVMGQGIFATAQEGNALLLLGDENR